MNRPRLLKGGFVYHDSDSPGKVIAFQYNPELLTRTITPVEGRIRPKEIIRFTLELDATDALEQGDPTAASLGLHPALSALELLVERRENTGGFFGRLFSWLSRRTDPFVLFVWGAQRVIPVRVLELIISEQMFDPKLNPIRVSIDVTLAILSDADLRSNPGAKAFMDTYRSKKETLARQSVASRSLEDLLKGG